MEGVRKKSFEVSDEFYKEVVDNAVSEHLSRQFPDNPIEVDITKVPNQFGLNSRAFSSQSQ